MKAARLFKALAVVCVATLCAASLFACSGNDDINGVAATVNGVEIPEEKVTKEVEHVRAQSGLSDDEQWGKFLVQNDMTPESVRSKIIDTMVEQELLKAASADLEISVEDSEIDDAVNTFKENYSSDESWQNALKQAGFTEDTYRENISGSMIEQKIGDYFEDQVEPTDEDYASSAKTYASYYDGAKRTSHILIGVDDKTDDTAMSEALSQATEIYEKVNSGALDFAAAASEYSTDEGSKDNGGDVGWDKLNSFVTEYTDAIEDLEVGQITEPVESEYGYHIIKVTEVFTAPESDDITSIEQIPEDFRQNIMDMAVSVKANTLYTDWLDGLKEDAEIVINDMPKGLPYDIDLTKYEEEQEAKEAAAAEESADADLEADATAADAVATDTTVDGDTSITVDAADGTVDAAELGLSEDTVIETTSSDTTASSN